MAVAGDGHPATTSQWSKVVAPRPGLSGVSSHRADAPGPVVGPILTVQATAGEIVLRSIAGPTPPARWATRSFDFLATEEMIHLSRRPPEPLDRPGRQGHTEQLDVVAFGARSGQEVR